MKVLLDHNIAIQIVGLLPEHDVTASRTLGWDALRNGELMKAAEDHGFEAMITADQSIFYQQNNSTRKIALVVVSTNYEPSLRLDISLIEAAVCRASSGTFEFVKVVSQRSLLSGQR